MNFCQRIYGVYGAVESAIAGDVAGLRRRLTCRKLPNGRWAAFGGQVVIRIAGRSKQLIMGVE
jgi:hypothetical protein